jgi:DNA-damage-inducible protein D
METRVALFQQKEIRKTIHKNEWWFVVTDVVAALTDSVDPHGYLKEMRRRDPEIGKGWGQIATPLSVQARRIISSSRSRRRGCRGAETTLE